MAKRISFSKAARTAAIGNFLVKGLRNVRNKKILRNTPKQQRKRISRMIFGKSKRSRKSRYRKRRRINFRGHINVKTDADSTTKTSYTNKVSKQQQRKINRRFKANPSPYIEELSNQFIDTTPKCTNKVKWFWVANNNLVQIQTKWNNFIDPSGNIDKALDSTNYAGNYILNQEQSIYLSKNISRYEIFNPSNYDMNLVIYDIVCKKDTQFSSYNAICTPNTVKDPTDKTIDYTYYSNPIALMQQGNEANFQGALQYGVGLHTNKSVFDIQQNPTDSYPFNTHYKIVGKKTIRLQPGATMVHKFKFRPKCLMNRGYFMYNYGDEDNTASKYGNQGRHLKDISYGTLFKVWGQIAGDTKSQYETPTGSDTPVIMQYDTEAVTNLSGRLMIKWWHTNVHYCMSMRATYNYVHNNNQAPDDEEDYMVYNEGSFKKANDEPEANDQGSQD